MWIKPYWYHILYHLLSRPGGKMWIKPYWYHILHHLLSRPGGKMWIKPLSVSYNASFTIQARG